MAQIEIILPAMGEGIIEAEITRWLVREGDPVELDTPLVEVATDKVDSEIPSPGSGILQKILSSEGDIPKVGQVIALISTGVPDPGTSTDPGMEEEEPAAAGEETALAKAETAAEKPDPAPGYASFAPEPRNLSQYAFLSPVIRTMARDHDIAPVELENVRGTGLGGRITRADLRAYIDGRESGRKEPGHPRSGPGPGPGKDPMKTTGPAAPALQSSMVSREQLYGPGESTVEEMDRMRKLIADHMVYSKHTAPHVTSFVESDVTGLVSWRERVKEEFLRKYDQKLTLTTLILETVARCLKQYPDINVSLDGYRIIRKSSIHVGMATALPTGNLIVPVIPHTDRLNLPGLSAAVNDLAARARANQLKPGEIQGGTFTVTNLGNFGNLAGTPVINQPQVAILAAGAIHKKPAVVQTSRGDGIGIRHMMILSLAYDHRIVDGALGGTFLRSIGDMLQDFDTQRSI
jgi:2-oxoglutarate dehydrogenase E2 component (dihydrolipoamide succinyltransferase)